MSLTETTHPAPHPLRTRSHRRYEETLQQLNNHSTMMIVTFQIIVALASVHAFKKGSSYPTPFDEWALVMDFLSLNIFELLHLDCMVNDASYETTLHICTLAPIGVGVVIFAARGVWATIYKEDFMRGHAIKVRHFRRRCPTVTSGSGTPPLYTPITALRRASLRSTPVAQLRSQSNPTQPT